VLPLLQARQKAEEFVPDWPFGAFNQGRIVDGILFGRSISTPGLGVMEIVSSDATDP